MTFSELGLSPATIDALPASVQQPTTIQRLAIPIALNNKDLLALAQTGSGKTLAFGLPLIESLSDKTQGIEALVIVPTRELAQQVTESLASVAVSLSQQVVTLCGGIDQSVQLAAIEQGARLVVATPGRLLDLLEQQLLPVANLRSLVLDEADRLLDMGFVKDIEKIVTYLPNSNLQTLMFSATLAPKLELLAQKLLHQPQKIEANTANSVVENINEQLFLVNKGSKPKALIALLTDNNWQQALVFINAKDSVDSVAKKLKKAGINVAALHGEKAQSERQQTLRDFHAKKINVLVATDVLARGIDIDSLPVVINLDLPDNAPVYVHRVGRTARAGKSGVAISLVCHGEAKALEAIRSLTKRELPLMSLESFPVTDKPSTGESKRGPKDKKANRRTAKRKQTGGFKGKAPKR
ncbi:MAG: DEAD/DEAH box helicase [Psychrobium sp.]